MAKFGRVKHRKAGNPFIDFGPGGKSVTMKAYIFRNRGHREQAYSAVTCVETKTPHGKRTPGTRRNQRDTDNKSMGRCSVGTNGATPTMALKASLRDLAKILK